MWSLNNIISQGEEAKQRFASVFSNTDEPSTTNENPNTNSEKTAAGSFTSDPSGAKDNNTTTKDTSVGTTDSTDGNGSGNAGSIEVPSRPTIVTIPPKKNTGAKDKSSSSSPSSSAAPNFNFLGSLKENLSKPQNQEMFNSLKSSWGDVVTATKEATKQAVQTIEQEQTRIQASLFKNGRYIRDVSQSLDAESLRDAEVVYITDRLITMSHPAMQSAVDGDITPGRKLAAIAHLLQKRHDGRYMVWNLSEMEYDYSMLDDQVMTFEFPGSPSPPLGLLMKILLSVESWLKADDRNVAVMHCLTGRGRTSTVMAAFLCWVGEAGFVTPNKALEYMAQCKKLDLETLTIPSQRRYVSYFTNMLDGIRPSQPPLLLKRILMSEAPKFEKYHAIKSVDEGESSNKSNTKEEDNWDGQLGCSPYLQIFKGGSLVFTTAASKSYNQGPEDLPFCFSKEGSITFPIETVVQGDILIRCRHLTRKGQRVSMFRAAMHTGYIPPKVLRLRKSEIDGACSDKRYNDDFFIDLVFEECSASMASKHLMSSPDKEGKEVDIHIPGETKDNVQNEASNRRMKGTIAGSEGSAVKVTASAYDSMLHRDSRFWDVISERRNQKSSQQLSGTSTAGTDTTTEEGESTGVPSAFWGPTIGRRREFTEEKLNSKSSQDGSGSVDLSVVSQKSAIAMQSFTIGGELDFTLDGNAKKPSKAEPPAPPKKDDLMDALMAIDDDDEDDGEEEEDQDEGSDVVNAHLNESHSMTEEIVFEEEAPSNTAASSMTDGTAEKDTVRAKLEEAANVSTPSTTTTPTTDDQPGTGTKNESIKSDKSKNSDDLNLDDLNLDDDVDLGMDGDDKDFDFDDDEDIQDLEAFLTKATG